MKGLSTSVAASVAIGAVSTAGDFIWATRIAEHRAVYGLIHGTLLFLSIGVVLGTLAGRAAGGALAGAAIGCLAAGSFYLLAPLAGFSAMFVAWCGAWVALAVLYGYLTRQRADQVGVRDVGTSTR